jgi:hypothetical protein
MSTQGIEQFFGPVIWNIDDHVLRGLATDRNRNPVTSFDRLTEATRQSVAVDVGPELFAKLIEALREPLERALQMEKRHRGGRPPDVERNYVVSELAAEWEANQGNPAPSGKTGPFITACNNAFIELGLDTGGLAERISRVLVRRRGTSSGARQNPR